MLWFKGIFTVTIIECHGKKVPESRLVVYSLNGFQSRDFASERRLEKLSIMMITDRKNTACHWHHLVLSPLDRFLLCVFFFPFLLILFVIWWKVFLSLSENDYQRWCFLRKLKKAKSRELIRVSRRACTTNIFTIYIQ